MFEHLDDPAPPSGDGPMRQRVAARRASLERRHRLVVGGSAAAVAAVALVGVAVGVTNSGKPAVHVTSHLPTTVVASPATIPTPVTTAVPITAPTPPLPALACAPLTPTASYGPSALPTGTRRTATVTLGRVSATLTGASATAVGSEPSLTGATLTVVDAGHTLLTGPVVAPTSTFPGTPELIPLDIHGSPGGANPVVAGPPADASSAPTAPLCLARLAPNAMPTVLIGLYLGGAHCCTIVRAIPLTSTGAGPPVDDDLGNPSAAVQIEGQQAVIVTADNNFAYAFTDFADSGMPVTVLSFAQGRFVDLTRHYPELITSDAATWWTTFNKSPSNGLGFLAAWVGDECLLGQSTAAWAKVSQLQSQGRLNTNPAGPTGAAYVQQLHALLAQHGYSS